MRFSRIAVTILSLITITTISLVYFLWDSTKTCTTNGPGSLAPLNEKKFLKDLQTALRFIQSGSTEANQQFSSNVVTSCINNEAAIHNFPLFIKSAASVKPNLTSSLIIFCLDSASCHICRKSLTVPQCVFMNLGVHTDSLVPGGTDQSNRDYWRLTFGRVFASWSLLKLGINIIPVDVDAIFLQNPFILGNGIYERPNDIAVVSDIKPFTFKYGDKAPINGGFLYFPGINKNALHYSRELLDRLWAKNCEPMRNEQLVTSSLLRWMTRKYSSSKGSSGFHPHMLSREKYLNFCSTDCGTGQEFKSIRSYDDLLRMEQRMNSSHSQPGNNNHNTNSSSNNISSNTNGEECSRLGRRKWVYFHAACLYMDDIDKSAVAKVKGDIQAAVYKWVMES